MGHTALGIVLVFLNLAQMIFRLSTASREKKKLENYKLSEHIDGVMVGVWQHPLPKRTMVLHKGY